MYLNVFYFAYFIATIGSYTDDKFHAALDSRWMHGTLKINCSKVDIVLRLQTTALESVCNKVRYIFTKCCDRQYNIFWICDFQVKINKIRKINDLRVRLKDSRVDYVVNNLFNGRWVLGVISEYWAIQLSKHAWTFSTFFIHLPTKVNSVENGCDFLLAYANIKMLQHESRNLGLLVTN